MDRRMRTAARAAAQRLSGEYGYELRQAEATGALEAVDQAER